MHSPDAPAVATAAPAPPTGFELADMIEALWRRKWLVVLAALVGWGLAVAWLNVAPWRYAAELRSTPAPGGQGGLGSSLRNLGGLASLAGVDLPQDAASINFLRYSENLRSAGTAATLAGDASLMRRIFAREWDAARGAWMPPPRLLGGAGDSVRRLLGLPVQPWTPPDARRLHAFLGREVAVERDLRNPLVTIRFRHPDAELAGLLVARLHREVDEDLRQRSLDRTRANIDYLTQQLARATIVEHRIALAQALAEQERVRMLAEGSGPFAADPVSAVAISSTPVSPRPLPVLAIALLLGGGAGAAGVLVAAYLADRRRQRRYLLPL